MNHEHLHSIDFQGSINASSPAFSRDAQGSLAEGSWNAIVAGQGHTRGFKGFTSMGANTGSRKMMPVGNSPGGIKDIGLVQGSGRFIEDIGKSQWGIGSGQPHIAGVDVPLFTLSSNLQVSVQTAGVYTTPVQAGLTQPSAGEIGIIATLGDVSNPVSSKIERRRPSTGARSLASPTSDVINPQSNRIRRTFPLAIAGQTHWRVYFTFQGFGGTGVHYLAKYGDFIDIPESVVAAGTVDGIARSLEFNYKDGDLVPIEASYDDYPPVAATDLIRLEQVMNLAGAYSDSTPIAASSTNTGTAIAVSKINNYESYVPTHLLFLPEQVTDVLSRPVDDYGYVGCENSIHAIQFVGYRGDELPPCTITTILPDAGISYPHNWATFRGQLAIYTAEGNLLMMDSDGSFDGTFAGPIFKIIQGWLPANTIIGYDPKNDQLILANGRHILTYSLISGIWRQIWLPDFGLSGTVVACTTSNRRLYISITNGAALNSYSFDTGSAESPISFVCNYQNSPSGNSYLKDISEIAISAETEQPDTVLALCINKNLSKTAFRQISVTASVNTITDAESSFSSDMQGKLVVIFRDDIGGVGIDYILGKVSVFTNSGLITLTTPSGGTFSPSASGSNLLMFCGSFVEAKAINAASKHFSNFFPNVPECRSYCAAIWMKGRGDSGNVLTADIFGLQYQSGRAL